MIDSLNCCAVTVVPNMALSFPPRTAVLACIVIRVVQTDSKVCIFLPAHSLALAADVVISGRVVLENSRSSYSRWVFDLEIILSLMTARRLEYPSNLN